MDRTRIQKILEDSTKLAEMAIPALEAQARLAQIEPEYKMLKKASEDAEMSKTASESAYRSNAVKLADVLVTRGILDDSNKVAFVEEIVASPTELFDVTIKMAGELRAESFGSPSDILSGSDSLDPFERLALE